MSDARYEDRFGAVGRLFHRGLRALRWWGRGIVGARRTVLLEIRWRLGDEVMVLPVVDAFARRYPNDCIYVLTNFPELFEGYPVVATREAPEVRVDRYRFLRDGPRDRYRAEHYAGLAGVKTPEQPPELRFEAWEAPALLGLKRPIVALARGASWPTKRWPEERWNAMSKGLQEAGCAVAVLGVDAEGIEGGLDLTGRTTVREAAAILHEADLLICCDSGLMHVALAAGTPVVALFGPTDPDLYVRRQPLLHALRSPAGCAGYWNHGPEVTTPGRCPLGHAVCLESISVETVLKTALSKLEGVV